MADRTIEELAEELAGSIMRAHAEEPVYGSDIVDLIRAVVRDELRAAQARHEAAMKLATEDHWNSDEFKAQVEALRQGRPYVPTAGFRPGKCDNCGYRDKVRDDGVCTWCGITQMDSRPN